jgi:hypothetical protein
LRQRMKPRAASGGGAWSNALPLFQHCCCGSRRLPGTVMDFWGFIL